jgi:hypothetical protein
MNDRAWMRLILTWMFSGLITFLTIEHYITKPGSFILYGAFILYYFAILLLGE